MNRIMEKALEYGFVNISLEYKESPNNLAAVSKALTEIIQEEGAVIPHAEVSSGREPDLLGHNYGANRRFLHDVNFLFGICRNYGLHAKTIQEALADEFEVPVDEIGLKKTGKRSKVFYLRKNSLSKYLREHFEESETVFTKK